MSDGIQVQVRFRLNPDDEQGIETESLWTYCELPGLFQIRNSPFYVFGISSEDIVRADLVGDGLEFREIVARGGHSTYRIFMQGNRTIQGDDFQAYWLPIGALGASYENANNRFVAVDIPPGNNIAEICRHLEIGEKAGIWVFEEAFYNSEGDSSRQHGNIR